MSAAKILWGQVLAVLVIILASVWSATQWTASDPVKAKALAERSGARAGTLAEAVAYGDAVILALPASTVEQVLTARAALLLPFEQILDGKRQHC